MFKKKVYQQEHLSHPTKGSSRHTIIAETTKADPCLSLFTTYDMTFDCTRHL